MVIVRPMKTSTLMSSFNAGLAARVRRTPAHPLAWPGVGTGATRALGTERSDPREGCEIGLGEGEQGERGRPRPRRAALCAFTPRRHLWGGSPRPRAGAPETPGVRTTQARPQDGAAEAGWCAGSPASLDSGFQKKTAF